MSDKFAEKLVILGLFLSALTMYGCATDNMERMDDPMHNNMEKSMEKPMMEHNDDMLKDSKKKEMKGAM